MRKCCQIANGGESRDRLSDVITAAGKALSRFTIKLTLN